ncbi:MAG: glycosyltransferase family 4 protein [Actinobacteria bacterium]|nr:glycosyltransferase family 4 protein [Actinomycetota bacterium]
MRIGLDGRGLCNVNRTRGIGRYTARLLEALAAQAEPEHRLVLFGTLERLPPGLLSPQAAARLEWRPMRLDGYAFAGPLGPYLAMAKEIDGAGLDLFHAIDHDMTPFLRTPSLVTVHDLILLVLRGPYLGPTSWRWMLAHRHAARRARVVVAVSENTRRDVERIWGIPRERIAVVYEGVSPLYRPSEEKKVLETCTRYGLSRPYFLYLGGFDPRKNLHNMLLGFKRFLLSGGGDHRLALCGDHLGFEGYIYDLVEELGLEERVVLTGFVPEEDLPALYSGADAFLCLSLYEGFGLPLLEAMACGVPVLASRASSIPEVVGDAGLLVDPLEPREIAAGLRRLTADRSWAREAAARGRERARRFTWERAAHSIMELYRGVLEGRWSG